jgi:hypothetical protein
MASAQTSPSKFCGKRGDIEILKSADALPVSCR